MCTSIYNNFIFISVEQHDTLNITYSTAREFGARKEHSGNELMRAVYIQLLTRVNVGKKSWTRLNVWKTHDIGKNLSF